MQTAQKINLPQDSKQQNLQRAERKISGEISFEQGPKSLCGHKWIKVIAAISPQPQPFKNLIFLLCVAFGFYYNLQSVRLNVSPDFTNGAVLVSGTAC